MAESKGEGTSSKEMPPNALTVSASERSKGADRKLAGLGGNQPPRPSGTGVTRTSRWGLGAAAMDCRARIERRRPALEMIFRLSVPHDT
jgi:hypothetical protein